MPIGLKLRFYGDPVLRKVATPVETVGPAERFLIQEMTKAMYEFDGAGLAAPQIGISRRIFIADAGDGPFVVINPEIVKKSRKEAVQEEGCLSLPKVRINVKRPVEITVRYLDQEGRRIDRNLQGLEARIFQHEMDHLSGRLLIDHANEVEREKFQNQLSLLETKSREQGSS